MPDTNPILAELARIDAARDAITLSTGPPPAAERGPRHRRLKREQTYDAVLQDSVTHADLTAMLRAAPREYLAMNPLHMLLIAAAPGVGKTTIAVELAEEQAAQGKRVLYLGPRADFFDDVRQIARHPDWWHQWHGRSHKDSDGLYDMCYRAIGMEKWLKRGYDAMAFCSNPRVCGWGYVKDVCPYHAQKETRAPIVFGQHQHLTLGHPLMETFDLIIGDENPFDAFTRHWYFDGRFVVPEGMDPTEPMTEILHELRALCDRDVKAEGPDLLNLLGGAAAVREACELLDIPVTAAAAAPFLRSGDDVDELPYFHLPHLASLLLRESRAAEAGADYPHRVYVANGKLHMLLRYHVNPKATNKIMWLDATANHRLYEAMFQRPVVVTAPQVKLAGRIYQVWSRSNGKSSLVDKQAQPTAKADQLQVQITRIIERHDYRNPAIISFKALRAFFEIRSGHFNAERGTNRFADCDALIVAGTPQPSLDDMYQDARMLFFDRMAPFNRLWSERDVPYAHDAGGHGYSYPVSGFWHDEDLQALLWQKREAEIIQSAHRARPILRDIDVWLLTNIPIQELPPVELLSIPDLFGAPEGIDPYRWLELMRVADEFFAGGTPLRSVDVAERMKVSLKSARHYLDCIEQEQPGRWRAEKVLVPNKAGKVGRPARALMPQTLNT